MFQVNEAFSCLHRKVKLPTPVQEETQCRGEPRPAYIGELSSLHCFIRYYAVLVSRKCTL